MPRKINDDLLDIARSQAVDATAERLGVQGLKRAGRELTGPCPSCGGTDRFSINIQKNVFLCRICGGKGDAIALVELVRGVSFADAVEFLAGSAPPDPKEVARLRAQHAAAKAKKEADAAKYRQWSRERGVEIWTQSHPFRGTPVEDYLAIRGLGAIVAKYSLECIRFHPCHKYPKKNADYTGPAMIAAIQGRDDRLCGVHQTWIDPAGASGKATILDSSDGKPLAAKLVQGSKKGGAIRLTGRGCAPVLVAGEGIETTATVLMAGRFPGASHWVLCDLGNMAGIMLPDPAGRKWSGLPDMTDTQAFIPPPHVGRLIYLQDGDSSRTMTTAKLEAGLRRAMSAHPGLDADILDPGPGVDFNDFAMGRDGAA